MKTCTALVVVLTTLVTVTTSYKTGFGSCPRIDPMKNFEPAEFEGLWYVIEMFSPNGKCVTLKFDRLGKHDFKVTEAKEYVVAQVVGIDHSFRTAGIYNSWVPHFPAKFHARWSNNLFGSAEATIVATDYWQYAVLVECQSLMYFMKRTSALVLSRKRDLDLRVLNEVKRDLCDSYGFDCKDFENVDHNRCSGSEHNSDSGVHHSGSPLVAPKKPRKFPKHEVATSPSTSIKPMTFKPITKKPTQAPTTPRVYGKLQLWLV